jgi:hypothetical protein
MKKRCLFPRNSKEMHRIITDYIENLYSNKIENLEEMNKLLYTYEISKTEPREY